jgi:hypothetical protein
MDRIVAEISQLPHLFDLDRDDLGEDMAEATAVAIFEYMDAEMGPDNSPWMELAPSYKAWKDKNYPGLKMGELALVMKDPEHLKGELAISAREVVQTYGRSDLAKQHAYWFQEGDPGNNRPARPFYDLNDLSLVYLANLLDARFAKIR